MMLKMVIFAAISASVQGQGLVSLLNSNPDLLRLADLINQQPALLSVLGNASQITVLAPNNAAIDKLLNPRAALSIASGPSAITSFLNYHVLNGTFAASSITNTPVFLPTSLVNTTYANVTGGQRVEGVLRNNTVNFISGNGDVSRVVTANQNFTGGILHVIDTVLTIPPKAGDVFVSAKLSSLYGALGRANLLDTVNELRDVTIFAPSNDAFKSIGSVLRTISNTDLSSVLRYHAITSTTPFYSSDIPSTNTTLPTVNGANVTVVKRDGVVYVNGAKVIQSDVLIAGGVVHVIDQVLNPAEPSASGIAFSGASSASDYPFTSGVPSATTSFGGATGTSSSSTSSSTGGAAMPMRTGVVGVAALFGAGAVFANI